MNRPVHALSLTVNSDSTPHDVPRLRELTLAGGCFWCLDAVYRRLRGVHEVASGYTGGEHPAPDYDAVCTGTTGHAEAVRVLFDEAVLPADVVMDVFFTSHDPTSLNRQGHDVGTQYRSAVFYRDEVERAFFDDQIARAQPHFERPIVTSLEPAAAWHAAEDVHQGFYDSQPFSGYCRVVIDPKIAALRQHYAAWLR